MKQSYVVYLERTPNNYAAYVPDLPRLRLRAQTWDASRQ